MSGKLMIVVHPGSACGSADFNLGIEAAVARDALAAEIMAWRGDVLVIDGDLSRELCHYAMMGLALSHAQDRANAEGRRMRRVFACSMTTPEWEKRALEAYLDDWRDQDVEVVVTGAWTQQDGRGCVDAVCAAISPYAAATRSEKAMAL